MSKALPVALVVIVLTALIASLTTYWFVSTHPRTTTVTRITTVTKTVGTTVTREVTTTVVSYVTRTVATPPSANTTTAPQQRVRREAMLLSEELDRIIATALLIEVASLSTTSLPATHGPLTPAQKFLSDMVGRLSPEVIAWPGVGGGVIELNYTLIRRTPNFVPGGSLGNESCVPVAGVSTVKVFTSTVVNHVNSSAVVFKVRSTFREAGGMEVTFTYVDTIVSKGSNAYVVLEDVRVRVGNATSSRILVKVLYEGYVPINLSYVTPTGTTIKLMLSRADGSLTIVAGGKVLRVPHVRECIEGLVNSLIKSVRYEGVRDGRPTYAFEVRGGGTEAFGNATLSLKVAFSGTAQSVSEGTLLIGNVTITEFRDSITLGTGSSARNYCAYLSTPLTELVKSLKVVTRGGD